MTISEIKELKFKSDDFDGEMTIKDYLKLQLSTLWTDVECFSGKRPLGNSGWDWEVYKCLIENGALKGTLDEDGYIDDFNEKEGLQIMIKVINTL